ncbi:zinc finger MYM-type protein 3 isoform X3 [Trichoplusia ni]|uniref:Zinc finger MYM-type protein 3 isoform X3 n=1 Tax=Trichoplusia ni TaxID=7111 RepID=A0A7E5W692_TRINI|nr:zinc finger MYM-type protein 3 isoform X3 [Trichoplusia ni]
MDEKESLPDKPSEEESQGGGDNAVEEKPGEQISEEVKEASIVDAGTEVSADSTEETTTSSEVKTDSDVAKCETELSNEDVSELQNHVDHDVSAEDSNSVKSDVAKDDDSKKDLVDTTDAESQEDIKEEEDKIIEESQDSESNLEEKLKDDQPIQSTSQETTSQESTSQDNSELNSKENSQEVLEDNTASQEATEEEDTVKTDEVDKVDIVNDEEKKEPADEEKITLNDDKITLDETKIEIAGDNEEKKEVADGPTDDVEIIEKKEDQEEEEKVETVDNDDSELKKDDEVGKPEFETAPNVSVDEAQEDHTQALDPFDALLKDANDSSLAHETAEKSDIAVSVNIDDDDDDHNADDHQADDHHADGDVHDDDEEHHPVTELVDEPGADEEVCLLPDIEREISEADKAEAEKALAEKRKQAEAEAAEASIPKEETEADLDINKDNQQTDEAAEHIEADTINEDASQENDKEIENENEHEHEEPAEVEENVILNIIQQISPFDSVCVECKVDQPCSYRFVTKDNETCYLCNEACVKIYQTDHPGQFTVTHKKYLIEEIVPKQLTCSECEEKKMCYFYYNYDGEDTNYCSMACLNSMMGDEAEKYAFKRRRIIVDEIVPREAECFVCNEKKKCSFCLYRYGVSHLVCENLCIKKLNGKENGRYLIKKKRTPRKQPPQNPPLLKLKVISNATDKYLDEAYKIQAKTPAMVQAARDERERTFTRRCNQCSIVLNVDEKLLTWETMDFCDEMCLGRYQNKIGSRCANCKNSVQHTSLGKYCVRFGFDIRQFCNWACLEEFKKGLKICCYCQRDISVGHQGFLAPVGDKGQFKDFCSQACMEKFDQMSKNPIPQPLWAKCAVCSLEKATSIEVEVSEEVSQRLCSDPCFAAFKFVNNIFPDQCRWCKKYFERKQSKCFTIYEGASAHCFCSKSCMNVYISNSRHIVPCNWCKVKKYNFDMIRRVQPNGQAIMMCSLNCLNLYQVSVNAVSSRRTKCDMCKRTSLAQYHLTMSDATVRNFCSYQCVMTFQGQYSKHTPPLMPGESLDQQKAVPTGAPRRTYPAAGKNNAVKAQQRTATGMPVISSVQSLAAPPPLLPSLTRQKSKRLQAAEPELPPAPVTPPPPPKPPTPPPPPPPKIYNHVIVKTLPPREVANKATMSKPMMVSKGVSCRPHPCTKECQTDPSLERRVLIPVPVPIYVPVPCAMWSLPFPVPVPIPIPIPTPVFIPTTRNSAKGILKEINKIHDKMPTDPFEAELLMMAEMVAGDKKKDQSDSDTDDDNEESFSPVAGMDGNNAFGEDMLQMALKMATEYEDQPVDLESAMTANTITPSSHPGMPGLEGESMHHHHMMVLEQQRAVAALRASAAPRKRAPAPPARPAARPAKRRRADPPPAPQPDPPREPAEKPDANMCLKYTFGVNAWKQWVMTKNAEIEKSSIRRKPFKSEILQLTADELNYSLCLFVKEVRKPNGSEYAPDTIYYLVLGIQQYLFENGRIDNIFTDPYYEKFTDCLDEVARKFSVLYNDSQYIVTRVEEEHLWESKQLGAHSPHVLLSTLMFFNTKHFNLVTVEEHMQLSFSHIMKHWKRNPNQPGQAKIPGSRNVLLRFYPPQSALEANSRKKKVYEQQENEENPLRCPVKLYEFYISKCLYSPYSPESVRTRNDVFYLQPERSCVPDSPVWYSTQALSRQALAKMLHRVKMVKEINIALLTS